MGLRKFCVLKGNTVRIRDQLTLLYAANRILEMSLNDFVWEGGNAVLEAVKSGDLPRCQKYKLFGEARFVRLSTAWKRAELSRMEKSR